jgi:uncharacterized protein with PhoU and TrkA domain
MLRAGWVTTNSLAVREQANARYMETRGEVPDEAREASDKARKLYDLLTRNLQVGEMMQAQLSQRRGSR